MRAPKKAAGLKITIKPMSKAEVAKAKAEMKAKKKGEEVMRAPKTVKIAGIHPYEAQDAVNTVARAHKHLQNPKMVAAMKAHMDGLNAAITGGLKPKGVRPAGARKAR